MLRAPAARALGLISVTLGVAAIATIGACSSSSGQDGENGFSSGSSSDTFGSGSASGSDGDGKAGRPQRCDAQGHCTCFNIASIGMPGHTGFNDGQDSTNAFTEYLDTQSSSTVDMYTTRPTLDADFLGKYDVIIVQWLVDGMSGGNGTGYWTFSSAELAALKTWVQEGGGLITLSGYDASSQEVTPVNQLLGAVTDLSYGTADVLGSSTSYCLGETVPLGGWVQSTPIGRGIHEVGAFHGRPVNAGSKATVDCQDSQYVYAAHEDVGQGHVFAFTDEWVTYSSQWFGIDAGAGCDDASANVVYQVPQFWFNAISYASQATECPFMLTGVIAR
jgi:hypothetical protein